MARLAGKAALVTGGSRGIGAAIARKLAEGGADVAVTYARSADRAEAVVAEVHAVGRKGLAIAADNKDASAVAAAVERSVAAFGRLGIGFIIAAIVLITYTRAAPDSRGAPGQPSARETGEAQRLIHCAGADPPPGRGGRGEGAAAVSGPSTRPVLASGVLEATVAGIGFGMFFVALDLASASGGGALAWPLLASAASSAVLVGAVAVARRADWRAARRQVPAVVVAGVLYSLGSWAFIFAVSRGWISIVAVIAALSPAPTTLLARTFLSESLSVRQAAGLILALAGVALVTAGLPE